MCEVISDRHTLGRTMFFAQLQLMVVRQCRLLATAPIDMKTRLNGILIDDYGR